MPVATQPTQCQQRLPTDARILVVEDNAILAEELCEVIVEAGGTVVGPFSSVAEAAAALDAQEVDAAALDININGEVRFDLAHTLNERGTTFVFVSGYTRDSIPARFSPYALVEKPVDVDKLREALAEAVTRSVERRRADMHAVN